MCEKEHPKEKMWPCHIESSVWRVRRNEKLANLYLVAEVTKKIQ